MHKILIFYSLSLNLVFDIYNAVSKNFTENVFWFQQTKLQITLLLFNGFITLSLVCYLADRGPTCPSVSVALLTPQGYHGVLTRCNSRVLILASSQSFHEY